MNKAELIQQRLPKLLDLMSPCRLCPRNCLVNRLAGETGFCRSTDRIKVASWAHHRGEEPPISGTLGSGTIFASNCTLGCIFCQNFPFSQLGGGKEFSPDKLADIFSKLADEGIHNFNFVTPTHVIPLLLEAWLGASRKAQELPIVYNCSGYESLEVLSLLEGIVDIYIPDIKYSDNQVAGQLSQCSDYVESNRATLIEMHRQVGELKLDNNGIATHGLIIRHLVLPHSLAGSRESFNWLKNTLGTRVHISLMSQYFPAHKAHHHEMINRPITADEYVEVLELVENLGFENVWAQDPDEKGGA
jgi:putative pyruvate formate lyase activating enzyme